MSTAAGLPANVSETLLHEIPRFDVERIRADFPILQEKIRGHQLVYLDNAATSQKPKLVIDAIVRYYEHDNANIHRGVHYLSERATEEYERARKTVQSFLGASRSSEIIFVRSATEAINLVAQTYGRTHVGPGDDVLITAMEHHSNIVPWQLLCEEKHAKLRVAPINDHGELILDEFERLLSPRTRIVAVGHVSNALGSLNPVATIAEIAHARNIPVLVDGAQAAPRLPINVQEIDCDFYAFSGHKAYGPTGIGVLYGKASLLEAMPPYQGGGDMISSVTFEKTIYNKVPHKFEAGTPDMSGAVGLRAAIEYLNHIGMKNIASYEHELLTYATETVSNLPGVRLVGTAREKAGVLSFVMEDIHPHDIGTILDQEGIAIRTGHHCAQPVMERFGVDFMDSTREQLAELLDEPMDPDATWGDVVADIYAEKIESTINQPTHVFDFPLEPFPITRRHPVHPELAEHFDAVIGGIELVSGDTELNDPVDQWQRFVDQRKRRMIDGADVPHPNDEEYARAIEYGYSPTAGGGMGVDRLVMILTERDTLREVIPFPIVRELR